MDIVIKAIQAGVNFLTANIQRIVQNIKTFLNRPYETLRKYVTDFIKTFLQDPKEKKDYVQVGKLFVSKKIFFISLIAVIAGMYCAIAYLYPWMEGKFWTVDLMISSEKYQNFTGKTRVHDLSNVVIYKGYMSEGKIQGKGTQYDAKGVLVYDGDFVNNQYEGEGSLYSDNKKIYTGNFKANLYEGEGELYDKNNGALIYKGSFSKGQRSGKGVEYNPQTGLQSYYGDFANDEKEGMGKAYATDGKTVIYEGSFKTDTYGGQGVQYESNVILYQGEFLNGLYNGQGVKYDVKTGSFLYEGSFSNGLYEGEGKLYDPSVKVKVYEGQFVAGKREGTGVAYDKLGLVSFSGSFKNDSVDYVNYLGKSDGDIRNDFGRESYKTLVNSNLILTYSNLSVSMVFIPDQKNTESYALDKVIMSTKNSFFGISNNSTQDEIQSALGEVYTSGQFPFDMTYKTIFTHLSLSLKSNKSTDSDKFLFGSYYIRLYYSADRTKTEAIELGSIQ